MIRTSRRIDKVRASRDGHEFHEAWAARRALRLVFPTDGLVGIAVEGLSPADQENVSTETTEVADLVFYYGKYPKFESAHNTVIVQLKYSIGSENVPFRAVHAAKTVLKFAKALRDYLVQHGTEAVQQKLRFELVTNRPIHPELERAISGLASGRHLIGSARDQGSQLESACGLKGRELRLFASKLKIIGLAGSLQQNQHDLSRALADWSAGPDVLARARLGGLRRLVRDKAGSAGAGQNVIRRTDILAALELHSADDLLPSPTSFSDVGKIVDREQLPAVIGLIPKLKKPLLIHAAGGVGKTVFIQSLNGELRRIHECLLFDCFGGGAYRSPSDARHLPRRGLIHIINHLACNGYCDPLLPGNNNSEEVITAFRARLIQAVATIQRASPGRRLILVLDAIDNAAEHAKDKGEDAFPTLLLESFHYSGPVPGVHLIVSCRTHRRNISKGDTNCEEFELKPFTQAESERYLRDRIPKATKTELHVAFARSSGNPRILEHLALSDRGLLAPSELGKPIKLDNLLKERIQQALREAHKRGYKQRDIDSFLAGLSVLPPPVPMNEYATAQGIDVSAVQSFAADLAPLLEQTKHGLIFRDEPTETFLRDTYAGQPQTLRSLAKNLFRHQGSSVYAATALPGLLEKIGNGKLLFHLAFDDRFPSAIRNTIGKQNIRYMRLKAAVVRAAREENLNQLVHLLVELSTLAAVNDRGTVYLLNNPDLVVASQDVDATRRLFESRTLWPGTRHARLAVAAVLGGDLSDAYRHAVSADEWISHYSRREREFDDKGGPEPLDIAAIPLCLVAEDRTKHALRYLQGWKDWYAYEVSRHLFPLLAQATATGVVPAANLPHVVEMLGAQVGTVAAALSTLHLDNQSRRRLLRKCAKLSSKPVETSSDTRASHDPRLQDALFKAGAMAVAMNLRREAKVILTAIPHERPRLSVFTSNVSKDYIFPFLMHTALLAAAQRISVTERMVLPRELAQLASPGKAGVGDREQITAALAEPSVAKPLPPTHEAALSQEEKAECKRFLDERLAPITELLGALARTLSRGAGKADKAFLRLLETWVRLRHKSTGYRHATETNAFCDLLGRHLLTFLIWSRTDLKRSSVKAFLKRLTEEGPGPPPDLIGIVAMLSGRQDCHDLAGETALRARASIEREDEVGCRASLFARLSRAILPASKDEAASYFRAGLEQMDAIGSGDFQFTTEMLAFAGTVRGKELSDSDVHTLTNIAELNMYEADKFPWWEFAKALSRTAGCRGFAKLARWHDRGKVSFDYTLSPYLTALIQDNKIDPAIAVPILRLSHPAELHNCGTSDLAKAIEARQCPDAAKLISDLIRQFESNNPGEPMAGSRVSLSEIAQRVLAKDSEEYPYLSIAGRHFNKVNQEQIEQHNDSHGHAHASQPERKHTDRHRAVKRILEQVIPTDAASMSSGLESVNAIRQDYDLIKTFFRNLERKVNFADRSKYIEVLSRVSNLDIYPKLHELQRLKANWARSSANLTHAFRDVGNTFIRVHPEDFVTHGYLSEHLLAEIAELSGIEVSTLVLRLILNLATPEWNLPASVWMGFATTISPYTNKGEAQTALSRLLNSGAAKLSSAAPDGQWRQGLSPDSNQDDIAAGLIWFSLGSPWSATRWRAAHAARSLARFGRWQAMDALIARYSSEDAHPYQASDLRFYCLHARLWLLIALARTAHDFPDAVSQHSGLLKTVALDAEFPHALFRHSASKALLYCAERGSLKLSESELHALRQINTSPFPLVTAKPWNGNSFYESRPPSIPEPKSEFRLDYEFDKNVVDGLAGVFDRSIWEVRDAITSWVQQTHPGIDGMYETGGREVNERLRMMNSRHHAYGQQLGWHALFVVAGQFLSRYPAAKRDYHEDPWHDWLSEGLITRKDGLWLADGTDWPPLATQVNLLEIARNQEVLTASKKKLLALVGVSASVPHEIVVAGDWHSSDNIAVHVISALVPFKHASSIARRLAREDPFAAWLPGLEEKEDGKEYLRSSKPNHTPWVVSPSISVGLDEMDPLGSPSAVCRSHFAKHVDSLDSVRASDPFKRCWINSTGAVLAHAEAWGRASCHDDDRPKKGDRLLCKARFLSTVLATNEAELVLFIRLRRYNKSFGSRDSEYWHTTAVLRITPSLGLVFYPGASNKLHKPKY